MVHEYLPSRVNTGPWITAYTLYELRRLTQASDAPEFVLPICSLDTPYQHCASLGELVLPPLFHEALDAADKSAILARITSCFPSYGKDNTNALRIVELPRRQPARTQTAKILAFSVDTAVEEHGPHLPLATDTIQSYSVLDQLAKEFDCIEVCRPLEYGQLTWGLPFGFSIDLTADLLTPYVTGYVNALARWKDPVSVYVVDVHGSMTHRTAIVEGLKASRSPSWSFRWLHEPLVQFSSERGDQHAGGVETALVERVSADLLDEWWWPNKVDEIAEGQLAFDLVVKLASDLSALIGHVERHGSNGIVGDIHNYDHVDAEEMFSRMMDTARRDVQQLIEGTAAPKTAGGDLW